MLYILNLLLCLFILLPRESYAQGQARFFDSEVDFFGKSAPKKEEVKEEECPECPDKEINVGTDITEGPIVQKTRDVTRGVAENIQRKQGKVNTVYLFITPGCKFVDQAVATLKEFKNRHKSWKAGVYVVSTLSNFRDFAANKKDLFSSDISFAHDLQNIYSDKFGVTKSPTFLIFYNGRCYRIAGQPDLDKEIQKLAKQ